MKGTIRIDHLNKNILISAAFAKAAMNIQGEEYKTLVSVRALHQGYDVIKREIKKNPNKESYRGLTYEYIEHYILTHDLNGDILKHYEDLKERIACHSIRYAHIKKWFLETFPEIDDFTPQYRRNEVAESRSNNCELILDKAS